VLVVSKIYHELVLRKRKSKLRKGRSKNGERGRINLLKKTRDLDKMNVLRLNVCQLASRSTRW